ncbi:MAG: hypothetical protein LH485_06870 [Sphingomonas bacterium]|nr:hypothetical protein [Sphingomonas bacterium]
MTGEDRNGAALLLVESLIHGLVARAMLTVEEAIEIVDIAADVEHQLHYAKVGQTGAFESLLAPLSRSLRVDLAR